MDRIAAPLSPRYYNWHPVMEATGDYIYLLFFKFHGPDNIEGLLSPVLKFKKEFEVSGLIDTIHRG